MLEFLTGIFATRIETHAPDFAWRAGTKVKVVGAVLIGAVLIDAALSDVAIDASIRSSMSSALDLAAQASDQVFPTYSLS